MNTKTLTVSRTTAILGAAAVVLAISGTSVVSTGATIDAVNDARIRTVNTVSHLAINERIETQAPRMSRDGNTRVTYFQEVKYAYEQVSITYAHEDGSPLTEGEFTMQNGENGLHIHADGVAPGDYIVVLHADDLYPSQLSGDIVFKVEVTE